MKKYYIHVLGMDEVDQVFLKVEQTFQNVFKYDLKSGGHLHS